MWSSPLLLKWILSCSPVDDHVVLLDEVKLLQVDRIVLEGFGVVCVVVERGLVCDDEIVSTAGGFAEHIHRVEKGGRDTGHGCVRVAGL